MGNSAKIAQHSVVIPPAPHQIKAMNDAWQAADTTREYQFNATTGMIEQKTISDTYRILYSKLEPQKFQLTFYFFFQVNIFILPTRKVYNITIELGSKIVIL